MDIGARTARYNPEYHAGAVLTCRQRRSGLGSRRPGRKLLLEADPAECSSTATARDGISAMSRACPR